MSLKYFQLLRFVLVAYIGSLISRNYYHTLTKANYAPLEWATLKTAVAAVG